MKKGIITFIFSLILLTFNVYKMSQKLSVENPGYLLNTKFSEKSELIIIGTVIKKEEIWNRRPNPMMGRLDFLEEIIYTVKPEIILKGTLLINNKPVTVSVKGKTLLILFHDLIHIAIWKIKKR